MSQRSQSILDGNFNISILQAGTTQTCKKTELKQKLIDTILNHTQKT